MKKLKNIFAVLLSLVLCSQALTAFAATEYSDGTYTVVKTNNNNVLITECALTDECIEIPEFVLGYPVAGVDEFAFFSCSYLTEAVLPPATTTIGDYAFGNNENLQYVTIPRWCDNISDTAFWNCPEVTIRCWYGTRAYEYAVENNITCMLMDEVVLGDANNDGALSISDVTAIQRHVAEMQELEGLKFLAADVDKDGKIAISDATEMQMYFAEYETEFPIGEHIVIEKTAG